MTHTNWQDKEKSQSSVATILYAHFIHNAPRAGRRRPWLAWRDGKEPVPGGGTGEARRVEGVRRASVRRYPSGRVQERPTKSICSGDANDDETFLETLETSGHHSSALRRFFVLGRRCRCSARPQTEYIRGGSRAVPGRRRGSSSVSARADTHVFVRRADDEGWVERRRRSESRARRRVPRPGRATARGLRGWGG